MNYNNYYWIGTDKDIECKVFTKPYNIVYESYKFIPNKKYKLDINKLIYIRYMDISFYNGKHPYRETDVFNFEKKFIISINEYNLYYQNYGYSEARISLNRHKELIPNDLINDVYYNITSVEFDIFDIGDININHLITEDEWRNRQLNKLL